MITHNNNTQGASSGQKKPEQGKITVKDKGSALRAVAIVALCLIIAATSGGVSAALVSKRMLTAVLKNDDELTASVRDAVKQTTESYLKSYYTTSGDGDESGLSSGTLLTSMMTDAEINAIAMKAAEIAKSEVAASSSVVFTEDDVKRIENEITKAVIESVGKQTLSEDEKDAIVKAVVAIVEAGIADGSLGINSATMYKEVYQNVQDLSTRVTELETKLSALQSKVNSGSISTDSASSSDVSNIQSNQTELEKKYNELKSQYEELAKNYKSLKSAAGVTTADLASLQTELKTVSTSLDTLQKESDETKSKYESDIASLKKALADEHTTNTEAISLLKSETASLISEYESVINQYKVQAQELAALKVKVSLAGSQEDIDKLNEQVGQLETALAQYESAVNTKIEAFQSSLDALDEKADNLNTALTNLQASVNNDMAEIRGTIAAEVATLTTKIDNSNSTLTATIEQVEQRLTEDITALKKAIATYAVTATDHGDLKSGSYVYYADKFYLVTSDIAASEALEAGKNITLTTVSDEITASNKNIASMLDYTKKHNAYTARFGYSSN